MEAWEEATVHRVKVADLQKWLNRDGGEPGKVTLRKKLRNT
jgi:hypothetical protein